MANPFARLDNICLLLVGIHEGLGVPGKSHRHKMNSDSVSLIALLSYKTIMKAYRKQHVPLSNRLHLCVANAGNNYLCT